MHKVIYRLVTLIVLAIFILPDTGYASSKKKNEDPAPTPTPQIKIKTSYISDVSYDLSKSIFNKSREVYPIYEHIRAVGFSDVPEEYDIWSSVNINPYQTDMLNMKDTLLIDISSYYPPSKKHVTSEFGFRRWNFHYGIDLKVHKGDSVYNAFDGVVRITRRASGYGYFVVVRHFNGLETLYAHLNKITVSPGDTLKSGKPLGLGGNTGRSTGYHLHFEVRYLGNPINPKDIIDFDNHTVKNTVMQLSAYNFEYKTEINKIRYWTIRKGDTLGGIAARTGVSVSRLCSLNGISRTSILRIGQRIRYT